MKYVWGVLSFGVGGFGDWVDVEGLVEELGDDVAGSGSGSGSGFEFEFRSGSDADPDASDVTSLPSMIASSCGDSFSSSADASCFASGLCKN